MTDTDTLSAQPSGSFDLGGDTPVVRLGFGTMRLTGQPDNWGPPKDHDEAIRVLRRSIELGVTLFDTADSYGPDIAEPLLREALYPYRDSTVIATKAGLLRPAPGQPWTAFGRPDYLRQQTEMSLRILGVERIDLQQLHRPDPDIAIEESVGEFKKLQDEGKIHHIGLSNVTVEQIERARAVAEIATVQIKYNLVDRSREDVLDYAEANGIGFIPWNPLAIGDLSKADGPLARIASEHGSSPSQLALAWLLHRSPVMLPIPGTSSVAHLEDNIAAAGIRLSDDEVQALEDAVA